MRKGELQLNKWHFKLGIIPVYYAPGVFIHFGIFKPIDFPDEGNIWEKKHYKGFCFKKQWEGFEINL